MKILGLTLFLFLSWDAFSEIPSGCRECMSQCPHATREFRPCDAGCPSVCSQAQAEEWRREQAQAAQAQDCYTCMSACPHATRDFKPCDAGCPEVCDSNGMREAFLKANQAAQRCGGATQQPAFPGARMRTPVTN